MNNNIARSKTRKIDIGSSGLILIGLSIMLFLIVWIMELMNNYLEFHYINYTKEILILSNIFKLTLISGIFLFIVQGLGSTIDYIMYKKIRGGSKRKNKYVPWGLFLI
ncbi:TPA: hypothetical protein KRD64_002273 [Clostridioides difficile]|uniref:hypothetical protein n=1 Tax=Clostridioides TaxID=1870884 RepID=UPI000C9C7A93|nr:hypothetical protein [Clostridioides difficile]MCC0699476.1 hypothetical protein [Clostridioides sp. ZZV15-6383]MCD8633470.1 hypothetical protein [Clostridioides difficile]HBF3343042.1 hypothetical protein [Clostridioides difficile]HBG7379704.1 hypothetical protein [Clostridioides difficile]